LRIRKTWKYEGIFSLGKVMEKSENYTFFHGILYFFFKNADFAFMVFHQFLEFFSAKKVEIE